MRPAPRAILASLASVTTVMSTSLALALPAMASDDTIAAADTPDTTIVTDAPVTDVSAETQVTDPVAVAATSGALSARVVEKSGRTQVRAATTPRDKGVEVKLVLRKSGKNRVLDTATTNRKGRAALNVPQRWADSNRTLRVSASGYKTIFVPMSELGQTVNEVPAQVRGVRAAVVWATSVDLRWNGVSGATSYNVEYKESSATDWKAASPVSVTRTLVEGLQEGVSYDFRVAAVNADGTGPFSTPISATTAANPPGAIVNLTDQSLDSAVFLDWGTTRWTQSYRVQKTCEGNTDFDPTVCVVDERSTTGTAFKWGGLANDVTYLFGVTATNVDGSGPRATITGTPKSKPAPVTNLQVTPGDSSVYVDWVAPAGAVDFRTYYRLDAGGGATYSDWFTGTEASITGLTNGTAYVIGVQARNAYGVSLWATDTNIVPNSSVPGPVGTFSATPGNEQVELQWLPADGADSYQVSYRESSQELWITETFQGGFNADPYSTVITGLTNGVEYEFSVYAENDFGRSAAETTTATPTDPQFADELPGSDLVGEAPGTMTRIYTRPKSEAIYVSWSAAPNSPEFYDVSYSTDNSTWTLFETNPATDRNSTITGLVNDTPYYVQVVARNADGASPAISDGPITPIAKPGPVNNVKATPSDSSLIVSWAAASGATRHRVLYRPDNSTTWAPAIFVDAPLTRTVVDKLENGRGYVVQVTPWNTSGYGEASVVGPVTPSADVPAPVSNTDFDPQDGKVVLTWDNPDGATGYRVTTTDLSGSTLGLSVNADVPASNGTQTTYTVPNLVNGHRYEFSVVATNSAGFSNPVQIGPAVPGTARPAAPVIVSVESGNESAAVTFTPGNDGGSPITNYEYRLNGDGNWIAFSPAQVLPPVDIAGLTNGSSYTVELRARNAMGVSEASNVSDPFTVNPPEWAAPSDVTVSQGPDPAQLTVNFTAPADEEGATLTGFIVSLGGSASQQYTGTGTSIVIDAPQGYTLGADVTVSVAAQGTTASGDPLTGLSSSPVPAAFYGAPGTPQLLPNPTVSNGVALVFVNPAGDDGGRNLENYWYSVDGGAFTPLSPTDNSSPLLVPVPEGPGPFDIAVKSYNGAFTSAASNTVQAASAATPPSAPLNVSATAGDASATVNWDPPADSGSAAVSSYTATGVTPTGATAGECTVDAPATSCEVTGLSNGTSYTFTVVASNGQVSPSSAASSPVVPFAAPDAPTDLNASVTPSGTITVDFTPGADNGRNITNYFYRYSDDGGSTWSDEVDAQDSSSPVVVQSLPAGTYVIQLSADNGQRSPWSASSNSVTVAPAPDGPAPVITQLTPDNALLMLEFTQEQPENVVNYAYQTTVDGVTGPWADFMPEEMFSPIFIFLDSDFMPIENGKTYTVKLKAIFADGTYSAASEASNPATPFGPASAPTNLVASPLDSACQVTFTPPANDGGATIVNYEYSVNDGTWTAFDPAVTTSPVEIGGLNNGVQYKLELRAYNGAPGDVSTAVACTPATAPKAPVIAADAVALDQGLDIVITTPGEGGSGSVANYEYTLNPDDANPTWVAFDPAQTTSPVRIVGLNNNQTYKVALRTVNDLTPAEVSGASNIATGTPKAAVDVPPAPVDVAAAAGDKRITVTFTQPGDGGAPVTSYVYSLNGDDTVAVADDTSPIVISGLTNGTSYTVAIAAVNSEGEGPLSATTTAVVPFGTPTAPVLTGVVPGDSQLTYTFTPGDGNGRTIVDYQYTLNPDDTTPTWVDATPPLTGDDTQITITGLTNNTLYTVALRTVTGSGDTVLTSVASNTVGGTPELPATNPAPPTALDAQAGDQSAVVTFTPGADGNRPITGYDYSLRVKNPDGSFGDWSDWQPVQSMLASEGRDLSSPVTITGLTNNTTYQVRLQAINSAGLTSDASEPSNEFTPAGVPCQVSATSTPGDSQLAIAVTVPADCGNGSAITGLQYSLDGNTWVDQADDSFVIASLDNGTPYTVNVRAVNAVGPGAAATVGPDESTTPGTVADAPVITDVTPGSTQLLVAFTQGSDGGRTISNYEYLLDTPNAQWTPFDPADVVSPLKIDGLTNGTTYAVKIRAVNSFGTSAESNQVSATPYTSPDAPEIAPLAAGDASLTVDYTVANTGGFPLANIQFSTDNGATWAALDPASASSPVVLTKTSSDGQPLENGTEYQVMIKAVTSAPDSPISNVSAASNMEAGTPEAGCPAPGAPTALKVNVTSTTAATATWAAPADSGACPVTYQVSVNPAAGVTINHDPAGATTASLTGLDAAQNYTVSVTAKTTETGPAATSPSFNTARPPASVTGSANKNQATFTWPAVPGASSYVVTCLSGCSGATSVTTTTYAPPPAYSTVFQISVVAVFGKNTSTPAVSNQVVTQSIPAPTAFSVSGWTSTSSSVTVSWSPSAGADYYTCNGVKFTGTSCTVNVAANADVNVAVAAVNAGGVRPATGSPVAAAADPAQPTATMGAIQGGGAGNARSADITITGTAGATYRTSWAGDIVGSKTVSTGSIATSMTFSGNVAAVNKKSGKVGAQVPAGFIGPAPAKPASANLAPDGPIFQDKGNNTSIMYLTWSGVPGATKYTLGNSITPSTFIDVPGGNTSHIFERMPLGTNMSVYVYACNAYGCSPAASDTNMTNVGYARFDVSTPTSGSNKGKLRLDISSLGAGAGTVQVYTCNRTRQGDNCTPDARSSMVFNKPGTYLLDLGNSGDMIRVQLVSTKGNTTAGARSFSSYQSARVG